MKVVGARNQAEAELLQGMLLEEGVPSLMRRSGGFDVPDFLASGPRDILVPASGASAAREILQLPEPAAGSGWRRGEGTPPWVRAMAVALAVRDPRAHRRGRLRRGLLSPAGRRADSRPSRVCVRRAPDACCRRSSDSGRRRDRVDDPKTSHTEPHDRQPTSLHRRRPARRHGSGSRTAAIAIAARAGRALARHCAPSAASRSGATPSATTRATSRPPPTATAASTSALTTEEIDVDADIPSWVAGDDDSYGKLRLRRGGPRRRPGVRRHRAHGRRRALPRRRVPHRGHRHRHRPVRGGVRRARRRGPARPRPPSEDIWVASTHGSRPADARLGGPRRALVGRRHERGRLARRRRRRQRRREDRIPRAARLGPDRRRRAAACSAPSASGTPGLRRR